MKFHIITLLICATACRDGHNPAAGQNSGSPTDSVDNSFLTQTKNTIVVDCDSIYEKKGYRIFLTRIRNGDQEEDSKWYSFRFVRILGKESTEIFKDTVESSSAEISFVDFNGDRKRDILIQNFSDARSNWTYNLFFVDERHDKLQRIRGFEEIKNPMYLPAHDIISNYVNSGTNWTGFYKINGDSVIDLGIDIEDDMNGDGSYQRNYDKAISTLTRRLKNNR